MSKKLLVLVLCVFSLTQASAEVLSTKVAFKSIRVKGKKKKVFDRAKLTGDFDTESGFDLSLNDEEGIIDLAFGNINNGDGLTSLFDLRKGQKQTIETLNSIVLTESDEGDDTVFSFGVLKAKATKKKKNRVSISFTTEKTDFDCASTDFNCDDTVTLQLKGSLILTKSASE